jgi:hypothetical protein
VRKYVEEQISKCADYQRNKIARYKLYGFIRLSRALTGVWKSIALDFIVKLPLLKEAFTGVTYDAILIVTDRLIKYAYFILYKEDSTTEELAYTFNRNVITNYGISEEIISNKDKLFISNF